eukprot:GHVN01091832.1.p2 GENE.GHVN01091832.1~~GHVN01091832.1.p2  ORF type:complete len:119 (+),score=42.54 GHVN01091832.1:1370-1726(+)
MSDPNADKVVDDATLISLFKPSKGTVTRNSDDKDSASRENGGDDEEDDDEEFEDEDDASDDDDDDDDAQSSTLNDKESLYTSREDKAKLMKMSELDREQILHARHEQSVMCYSGNLWV